MMDLLFIIILIIICLCALLILSYIINYNKIQKYTVRINEAECEIDETLRKRYDTLVSMENIINDKTDLTQNNFSSFKSDKMTNFEIDRKLTKITETLNKIHMDYSDELNIEAYRNLLVDLKINEEKCDASKSYYNKYTTDLNMLIKKFPTNIIAKFHGVKERLYFDNKIMNDENIIDFKL